MKRYVLIPAGSAAILCGLLACADNRMENITEDMVYITNSGEIEISAYPMGTGETKLDVWAIKSGNNGKSGHVRFTVDEELLREYNLGRDEQNQLSMLPEDCYRLEETDYAVSTKNPSAPFAVYYDIDKIAENYTAGRNYMLPVRLISDNLPVNTGKDKALLIFDVMTAEIGFMEYGSQVFDILTTDTEYTSILNILADVYSPVDATVVITGSNQRRVDEYNASNNSSYKLIPEDAYSISNTEPILYQDEITMSIEVKIDSRKIPSGRYLLPVEIASATPFNPSPTGSVFYYVLNNYEEWWTTAEHKAGWSIAGVSSNGDGGEGPFRIIDGSTSSGYWGINWRDSSLLFDESGNLLPDKPQWVVVDLGEVKDVCGVKWYPRAGYKNNMSYEFYVTDQQPADALFAYDGNSIEGAFMNTSGYDYNEPIWQKVGEILNHGGTPIEVRFTKLPARYIQIRLIAGEKASAMSEIDILWPK